MFIWVQALDIIENATYVLTYTFKVLPSRMAACLDGSLDARIICSLEQGQGKFRLQEGLSSAYRKPPSRSGIEATIFL
jgi:hypothetical protein